MAQSKLEAKRTREKRLNDLEQTIVNYVKKDFTIKCLKERQRNLNLVLQKNRLTPDVGIKQRETPNFCRLRRVGQRKNVSLSSNETREGEQNRSDKRKT